MIDVFFSTYLSTFIRFLFLLSPFFVVSMFLALTLGMTEKEKNIVIRRSFVAILGLSIVLFFAGPIFFATIGITLNSFRVGAGAVLFLMAINLVNSGAKSQSSKNPDEAPVDISVVPLAIPVIVGPAVIGAILVYGAELTGGAEMSGGLLGMISSLIILTVFLKLSGYLERALGQNGLTIMSKISGLILATMAAEIILTGITGFIASSGLMI